MRSCPLVASALFACTLLAAGPAPAATAPPPPTAPALQSLPPTVPALPERCDRPGGKQKFRITLKQEAELGDLVEWMMSVSCQKFIWDPKLRTKTVNIVAPEPVTMSEAYAAFHAALATIGATVEPAGDFYRIVETSQVASRRVSCVRRPGCERSRRRSHRHQGVAPSRASPSTPAPGHCLSFAPMRRLPPCRGCSMNSTSTEVRAGRHCT